MSIFGEVDNPEISHQADRDGYLVRVNDEVSTTNLLIREIPIPEPKTSIANLSDHFGHLNDLAIICKFDNLHITI